LLFVEVFIFAFVSGLSR